MATLPSLQAQDLLGEMAKGPVFELSGLPKMALAAFSKVRQHPTPLSAFMALARRPLESLGLVPRTEKPESLRALLEKVDTTLLARLYRAGFLSAVPAVEQVDATQSYDFANSAAGWKGRVGIASNHRGERVGDFLPHNPAHSPTANTLSRWMVLLHEAAHCEWEQVNCVFDPSPGRCTPEEIEVLNTWVFAGVEADWGNRTWLNECFADTYACMMLLEATNHDKESCALVEDVIKMRLAHREEDAAAPIGHGRGKGHFTDRAMARMLEQRHAWKGQPAEQLKRLAIRYASDGLLDLAEPGRMVEGHDLGYGLRFSLIFVKPSLSMVGLTHQTARVLGGDAGPALLARFANHPLQSHVESLLHRLSADAPNGPVSNALLYAHMDQADKHLLQDPAVCADIKKVQAILEAFIEKKPDDFQARVLKRQQATAPVDSTAPAPLRPWLAR